jgi:5-(carboxyamino)imidazole ribonucleotide synthase
MNDVIEPGATIGVLGSGQLGRMFTIAARRMGYRVHVLSPDYDTPTGQVADREIHAAYEDTDAVARFAQHVDVVTFEFENVPLRCAEVAGRFAPIRPAGHVLHTTQNRLREKRFLQDAGFPVTTFEAIESPEQCAAVASSNTGPGVLKSASWGYDGKGQHKVQTAEQLASAWDALGGQPAILENFVDFQCELSVVAARSLDGQFVAFSPVLNHHEHHILDVSISPAPLPTQVTAAAKQIAREILEALQVVGVLCVEFFLTKDHQLLVNELAPRPHNSGHLTIDAHVSCQFEQQVRAVCGLPLGSTRQLRPAAMANLLGDLWQGPPLSWRALYDDPAVKVHLYGKREARPGRKMGHLTALAETPEEAAERVRRARAAIARKPLSENSLPAISESQGPSILSM